MQPPVTESRSCRNQRETGLGLVRGGPWHQPRPEPTTRSTRGSRSLSREVAGGLVTAIVVSLLMKTSSRPGIFIPSASMEPTLHGCSGCAGDKVLVNRATTHPGGAHRGDIVVFRDSAGWLATASSTPSPQGCVHDALAFIGLAPATSQSDLIKYVIGVGGDTVEGKGGRAYVNGALLNEPYAFPGNSPTNIDFRATVPAGKLWVMGDHRSQSADSRFHLREPGKGLAP